MAYAPKIVLHCPYGYRLELDALVEQFLIDGVKFVGVVGSDCALVEDLIDEIVVGDGKDPDRFILTSAHPGESIDDVVEFARQLTDLDEGDAQVVALDMRPPLQ